MAVQIGDVILSGGDPPEAIPFGSKLNGTVQTLSDGSVLYPATGVTPQDITISGTLRRVDGGGAPADKVRRLFALLGARQMITLAWGPWSYQVLITAFTPTDRAWNEVAYALTFFRGLTGAFTSKDELTNAARAEALLDRLATLAPRVGAKTAAAHKKVQTARGGSHEGGHRIAH